jgi:hypothetical protein
MQTKKAMVKSPAFVGEAMKGIDRIGMTGAIGADCAHAEA